MVICSSSEDDDAGALLSVCILKVIILLNLKVNDLGEITSVETQSVDQEWGTSCFPKSSDPVFMNNISS